MDAFAATIDVIFADGNLGELPAIAKRDAGLLPG